MDLPHNYTSDISFQETFVDAADSQFLAQRLGQNCNFLLDDFAAIQTNLTSIENSAAFVETFDASGGYSPGDHVIFAPGHKMYMAVLFVQPIDSAPNIANNGGVTTHGPPIPIIVTQNSNGEFQYTFSGGGMRFGIENGPSFNQIVFHLSGTAAGVSIIGLVFHQ